MSKVNVMDRCKVICIEGHDKSGKETQTNMLYDVLSKHHSVTLVEVPAKGLTHKAIYWMLSNKTARRFPNTFQFVQFINKLSFQLLVLPTLKAMSDYVILDRWSLSAIVYGDATGVNRHFNRFLYSMLAKPDVTLVMTGKSFTRSGTDDEYEKDNDLQRAVKGGYLDWVMRNRDDHELVNNVASKDEVHASVVGVLTQKGFIE